MKSLKYISEENFLFVKTFEEQLLHFLQQNNIQAERCVCGIHVTNGFDQWIIIVEEKSKEKDKAKIQLYHKNLFFSRKSSQIPDMHVQYSRAQTISELTNYIINHAKKYEIFSSKELSILDE